MTHDEASIERLAAGAGVGQRLFLIGCLAHKSKVSSLDVSRVGAWTAMVGAWGGHSEEEEEV